MPGLIANDHYDDLTGAVQQVRMTMSHPSYLGQRV